MRAAPPVEVQLASGRRERCILVLLHAWAGAQCGVWAALWGELPAAWTWAAALSLAGLMAGLGCRLGLRSLPACGTAAGAPRLRWDGRQWWLHAGADAQQRVQQVQVAIDLGPWLLLQLLLEPDRSTRWAVVDARSAGAAWHGLRRAVLAHAGRPSVDGPAA